jgi:hypothetical protein
LMKIGIHIMWGLYLAFQISQLRAPRRGQDMET